MTTPDPDMALLEQMQAERRQMSSYRAAATEQQSAAISGIAVRHPWMSANVTVPLGLAGTQPDDPIVDQVAGHEVKRKSRGFGWHSIGDAIKTGAGFAADPLGGVGLHNPLRHVGGDLEHLAAHAAGFGAKEVGKVVPAPVSGTVKGFARGASMGLSALPQAIQGEFRDNLADGNGISAGEALGVLNPKNLDFGQSDLGQGIKQIREHGLTGLSYGSGYFAGGDIVKGRRAAERASGAPLIDGHAPSIGRYFGRKVFEPGSTGYNIMSGLVDGGLLLAADPTTWLGGGESTVQAIKAGDAAGVLRGVRGSIGAGGVRKASDARDTLGGDASRRFKRTGKTVTATVQDRNEAGMITGTRNTILPDVAAEWLLSNKGQRVVNHLSETTDFAALRRQYGGEGKIDTETLVRLADASTPQEVTDILGPKLGKDIYNKPVPPPRFVTRPDVSNVRLAAQMPGSVTNPADLDDITTQLDRVLLNAKLPQARRNELVEQMARTVDETTPARAVNKRYNLWVQAQDEMKNHILLEHGVAPERASSITRIWHDYDEELRKYFTDTIGKPAVFPGVQFSSDGVTVLPTPHLQEEMLHNAIPIPNVRDMRAATSKFGGMLNNPAIEVGTAAMDFFHQQLFKPAVLLRGAWVVRVIGEEQFRLLFSGHTNIYSHPLSHIAVMQGKKLDESLLSGEKLSETEQHIHGMSEGMGPLLDQAAREGRDVNRVRLAGKSNVRRGTPRFAQSWADEMALMNKNPLIKRVASGGLLPGDRTPNPADGLDGIKDWFFNGAGRNFRKNLIWQNKDDGSLFELSNRQDADDYVDSALRRLTIKTHGHDDLRQVVATGLHNGKQVFGDVTTPSLSQRSTLRDFMHTLQEKAANGEAPDKVIGDIEGTSASSAKGRDRLFAASDHAVQVLFSTLMSKPTNTLSRSPAFKQYYWNRSAELVRHMDPTAQAAAIAQAEKVGVAASTVRKMKDIAASTSGDLSLEHADTIAKGHALDKTQELLYDLHKRSQFFDINRNIMPFGEAWKEVLGTWARIGRNNPVVFHRFDQAIHAGRSGDINGDGRAFLHPDPVTGKEMVSIPFSQEFNQLAIGVPASMQFSAQSANVFTQSVLPGFGPMVQMAAGAILPDSSTWNGVRNAIIPFGQPDTEGGFVENSIMPSWWKKVVTSGYLSSVPFMARTPAEQRAYLSTSSDVLRYLVSTGKYDMTTEDGQDKLKKDVASKTSALFLIRGIAQNISPAPPTAEFQVKDKNGRMQWTFDLAADLRKMQNEKVTIGPDGRPQGGYIDAIPRFIDKWGDDALTATVPKTQGGSATTEAALAFARDHGDIVAKYPGVFAYFTKADGTFDPTELQRQIDSGTRTFRTVQETIDETNRRLGSALYYKAKLKAGPKPSSAGRDWLRQVQEQIQQEYPGYTPVPANMGDTPKMMSTMERAAKDPVLSKTDAGKGLALYLKARDKANEVARQRQLAGVQSSSPKADDLRNWLRTVADQITVEHPDFGNMFDMALSRELGVDKRGQ